MTRIEYNNLLIKADWLFFRKVFTFEEWNLELKILQKSYYS